MLGLYIHIPFCDKICFYCDFPKRISNINKKQRYVDSLITELDFYTNYMNQVKTIYIGGGTPSSMPHTLLEKLFSVLPKDVKEFTVECNPNDITEDLLTLFKKYNVDRISLGVQSFNDNHLKLIGRTHSKETTINSINLINKYNFNLSIDMIFNIPSQTSFDVKEELKIIEALNIDHVSYYSLILEDKTIFNKMVKNNSLTINDIDIETEMFELVIEKLTEIGFNHYEISNFARPNKESQHNKIYWDNEEYIGVGMSASGYLNGVRYQNINLLDDYIEHIAKYGNSVKEKNLLSLKEKMFNELMLGFRQINGIDIQKFKYKYGKSILDIYPELTKLIDESYIYLENDNLKLTKKGIFLNNEVLVRLL
ncbi:radical SAM family heme chaperone HemW [Mycoplasmatota bacterium]|nr:radical SAM family heme chaperone HemW [Mycoplasmatota bacterium]